MEQKRIISLVLEESHDLREYRDFWHVFVIFGHRRDANLALWLMAVLAETDISSLHTHTHTRLTAHFSGTTRVSPCQKGKTNLDFTEARDSEWQWHQLGHMQVCT